MSNDIETGDILTNNNGSPLLLEKPVGGAVHVLYQHFGPLDIGTKYNTLFSMDERHMVNGINSLYGTDFTWGKLNNHTHEFFNPIAQQPYTRLQFSYVGVYYIAQVVVNNNLQVEGAKPSTLIGEMLSKDSRPVNDTVYFASRDQLSILTSFMHTNFSTRHMSFNPTRDVDSAFLLLGNDTFLTPVVLNNYRNNGGYSALLFKNDVLPVIELDIDVYSKDRVAVVLGDKLGIILNENNFISDDVIHAFDPFSGVNDEYTIFKLIRGDEVRYVATVSESNVTPPSPVDPVDPPVEPEPPVETPTQIDLSKITNNGNPGQWYVEVETLAEREAEYDNIMSTIIDAMNAVLPLDVTIEDLYTFNDYYKNVIISSNNPSEHSKVINSLTLTIHVNDVTVPDVEEPVGPYGATGLHADYPGTGWYLATDTGTVFCKNVPSFETCMFVEGGLEYVSVHTLYDAKDYGARAATSNVTDMGGMYFGETTFNEDISSWDVSGVINMNQMFYGCTEFNQPLGNWSTGNVEYMWETFRGCPNFNQDISSWDVGKVIKMDLMFYKASSFNQDLSGWCVPNMPTTPKDFAEGATAWTLPQPVWGTCPGADEISH